VTFRERELVPATSLEALTTSANNVMIGGDWFYHLHLLAQRVKPS
jgi:hypothetical protein